MGYLLSLISNSVRDPYFTDRKGCPQIIPGLRSSNFWDCSEFPWVAKLESKLKDLQQEFLKLRDSQNIQVPQDPSINEDSTEALPNRKNGGFQRYLAPNSEVQIVDKGKWNVCYLLLHGMDFDQNATSCPVALEVINSVPGQYHHAFFSALAPGSHIGAHYGPTNKKLRCYFPIFVPPTDSGRCWITVNHEQRIIEEGKCIIFDDSFLHEAANENCEQPRINLIFDFWHPDLTAEEVITYYYLFLQQHNSCLQLLYRLLDQGFRFY
jgi:aspartate beta-hydroxylase